MKFDVIIVGLGPAGAHFSSIASKCGYSVLGLERKTKNREKICAGGISPTCVKILKRTYGKIPSNVVERKIHNVFLASNKDSLLLDCPKTEAFTTYRSKFDDWLRNEASDHGSIIKERCELKQVKISSDFVKVKIREKGNLREITSNCIIGAYGLGSSFQKSLGVGLPRLLIAIQYELEFPARMINEFGDTISLHYNSMYSKKGYSWIFPKKNRVTAGLLDSLSTPNLKEKLDSFISKHLLTSKKPSNVNLSSHRLKGALVPNEVLPKTYGERFIVIGDAAGFSDRITWEGVSFALRSAELAANTFNYAYDKNDFSTNQLSDYQKKWKIDFGVDLEFGKKLQRIMFNKKLDANWSKAIKIINEDDELKSFFIDELGEHMSLAKAFHRLHLSKKIKFISMGKIVPEFPLFKNFLKN